MDITPEIGNHVRCDGNIELIEVASTNVGNSTFIGLLPDGDEVRQESFLFSQITEMFDRLDSSHILNLKGIGPLRIELSPREEAQFLMARAGELAAQKRGFILGGTSTVKTKREGN